MAESLTVANASDTLEEMSVQTFAKICNYLKSKNIQFTTLNHKPTYTSEESAAVRGVDVSIGGKAILMKLNNDYKLFVISASRKLDSKKIKEKFKIKNIRFASTDELKSLTGLVPGCVPPFGEPILPFEVFIDESILKNKQIAFNAGSLTDSIIMDVGDYFSVACATAFDFSS